ncbi:GNAT family N-acetyltransferase [Pseudoglutamicibacter cumminsii]|uniref:GNAT family N-acetyltransferase n=1 Tax=Pseudoglutamicibacter cumminsii TaxID=156979 RepID=UPI00195E677D|nr:GNAT family N-acetyltransferase [Pseudoglutamicibacter cumminsii]MBM7795538.1 putative GNAT family acetyltransferase [Pseudoglutamicibacter cumminsii]
MNGIASDELIGTWVKGWAEARGFDTYHEGPVHAYRRTGQDEAHWEYVVHEPDNELLQKLAHMMQEHSGQRLTVFTEDPDSMPDKVHEVGLRVVANREVMMTSPMAAQDVEAPITEDSLVWQEKRDGAHTWVSLHRREDGAVLASGHMASIGDYAVFDRIVTAPDQRRKGYGTLVTRYLASVATETDAEYGLLVASTDGYELYHHLGWTLLGAMLAIETPDEADDTARTDHTS